MKKLACVVALSSASLLAQAHNVTPGAESEQAVLLQGGTVYTITHGTLQDTDILMLDGKIAEMGTGLAVPEGARVIDIRGQHVYPGLIALDTTLGLVEMSQIRATVDTNEVGLITPEVMAHQAFNADSEIIPTVRYNGITHAQVVPQGPLLRGQSSLMQLDGWNWQDALEQGPLGMHLTWPRAGLNTAWWERRSPEAQRKANEEQIERLKDTFKTAQTYHQAREAGAQKRVDQRWEAMRALFTGDAKLFVHADDRRQILQALEFNREYGFDLVIMGGRDAWMEAETLAEAGVPVVFGAAYGLPTRVDDAYDTAFSTPAKLAAAGVDFAIAYPGFWDTRNLAFAAGNAVAFGLDYDAAITAITYAPAKILGVEDRIGSLSQGKQATLIVSEGDVLDHLGQRISYMFIDGREVNLSNRQRQLYEKYQERLSAD
ncbi:amidohydrolase family protein [Aliidiomarina halalkaliphila]|uniref:Amidohydrolase family protein n=1 Tax=Aliidiomarina halalkaliphila TaxID=2593535 RepID=A0A552X4U5_9GAMM|nr:amidohydrolase family protein [Aliidiomarina halalkaliphila]TRW50040.1 amidohydrolase family protein [Aliidiomarina halalkaliphila]